MVRTDGSGVRLLVRESEGVPGDNWAATVITHFDRKQFSSDGRYVFFQTPAWVTSGALHVYDFLTGRIRYIAPANDVRVLSDCENNEYRDLLVVSQHRYFVAGGSYDWYWLIDAKGQEVGPVGPDLAPMLEACRLM